MMAKSPKMYYFIILLMLILALTGCELRRDNGAASDLPTGGVPPSPTLASLGAVDLGVEATPIPTVINGQPTVTPSLMGQGQAAENPREQVAPTAQPVMAITPVVSNQAKQISVITETVAAETFVPPAQQASTAQPVIVNATSPELPDGGPVAANPPAGQANGYSETAAAGSTYVVQAGDTLFSLSARFGATVEDFMAANNLASDMIYEGQVLNIPTAGGYAPYPVYDPLQPDSNGGYHLVAAGETLFSLAQRYGASVEAIAATNGI
ncbi:MAG: LysM peptidoglycan-binding domain-containing protein, partial [Dehalococcoidia bacterium]